jgi:nucleotide-binding universal stress UspA family protein
VERHSPFPSHSRQRAADLGADMIVARAYHHSQLRETLLGGVSRDLLDHMTVPVLMSH